MQHFHVARVGGGAIEYLGGDMGLAHLLRQVGVLHGVETGTRLAIGQEEIPQPAGPGFVLQAFHDVGLASGELPAVTHGNLIEVFALQRRDFLFHKVPDISQYRGNFCADSKIHCVLPPA